MSTLSTKPRGQPEWSNGRKDLPPHDVVRSVRRGRVSGGFLQLFLGQPKVPDLDGLAVPTQENVSRLQVAVDDTLRVRE